MFARPFEEQQEQLATMRTEFPPEGHFEMRVEYTGESSHIKSIVWTSGNVCITYKDGSVYTMGNLTLYSFFDLGIRIGQDGFGKAVKWFIQAFGIHLEKIN